MNGPLQSKKDSKSSISRKDFKSNERKPLTRSDLDLIREVISQNPELTKVFAKLGLKVVSIEKPLDFPPV